VVAAKHASRAAVFDCRENLEKLFLPLEKKRGEWEQLAAIAEFHHTERALIDRLGSREEPAGTSETPAEEYTGAAREKLLAAIQGLAEKAGEDEWEKARRLGHEKEMRRSAELVNWHAVLKYVPGQAVPMGAEAAKGAGDATAESCFMTGQFDFFRETLPVTAFLETHAGMGDVTGRIFLATLDIPLRAPTAADIEKGKRRAQLELWFRLDVGKMTTRTLGGVTDICIPTEVKRVMLKDEATGEVLSDKQETTPGKTTLGGMTKP
jgi:hypothetical protein